MKTTKYNYKTEKKPINEEDSDWLIYLLKPYYTCLPQRILLALNYFQTFLVNYEFELSYEKGN